jgi:hypothetical protein
LRAGSRLEADEYAVEYAVEEGMACGFPVLG